MLFISSVLLSKYQHNVSTTLGGMPHARSCGVHVGLAVRSEHKRRGFVRLTFCKGDACSKSNLNLVGIQNSFK